MKSYNFSKSIILASASPRRRELLDRLGLQYEVRPSNVEEENVYAFTPGKVAVALSREKAKNVCRTSDCGNKTVIAADTVVYKRKIYTKPSDALDAINMLMRLNGRWHSVYTGVTVRCNGEIISFVVRTRVKFKELSRREIEDYVINCSPLDKAGGYGIQDNYIVEKYRGSYSNVVGLPLEKLSRILTKAGVLDGNRRTFH